MCPQNVPSEYQNSYYQSDQPNNDFQSSDSVSFYQSAFQSAPQASRGGSNRGRGGGRGRHGGRGAHGGRGRGGNQQTDSQQQSQSQGRQVQTFTTQPSPPQTQNSASFPDSSASQPTQHFANKPNYSEIQQGQLRNYQEQLTTNIGQKKVTFDTASSNFMTPTDPNILREKFNIPPDMTLNVYYVEDDGTNILNGFNYEQPPQSEEQHIHLIKQRFDIPDNMKVSSYYVGNSINDIRCEESSPAFNVLDNGQHHLVYPASDNQATLAKDVYHSPYEEPKPVVIHDGPPLPDPTAGLHDRSSRGGDDGEETGGYEHDYPQCDHHCMDQNSSQHTTQNSHQLTHQLQQSQGQLCNSSKINDVPKQAADIIIFDN